MCAIAPSTPSTSLRGDDHVEELAAPVVLAGRHHAGQRLQRRRRRAPRPRPRPGRPGTARPPPRRTPGRSAGTPPRRRCRCAGSWRSGSPGAPSPGRPPCRRRCARCPSRCAKTGTRASACTRPTSPLPPRGTMHVDEPGHRQHLADRRAVGGRHQLDRGLRQARGREARRRGRRGSPATSAGSPSRRAGSPRCRP